MTASHLLSPVAHTWSEQEKRVLIRTTTRACPCGAGTPWTLEITGPRAHIFERFDALGWHHDVVGRDRVIACGAALAALVTAVRVLGWAPEVALLADARRPDLVSTVTAHTRQRPTSSDVRLFRAAFESRRHRHTVDPHDLPPDLVSELVQEGMFTEVRVVPVPAFVPANRKQTVEPGLLVVTATDGRRDQVLAGAAMQRMWFAAKARGLTADPQIQPFSFRDFRQRLLRRYDLGGSPQLLLRLGIPPTTD